MQERIKCRLPMATTTSEEAQLRQKYRTSAMRILLNKNLHAFKCLRLRLIKVPTR